MNALRTNRRNEERRDIFILRQVLNIFFIIAVIALIVAYFVRPSLIDTMGYKIFCMFVVLVKISEMIIRFISRKNIEGRNK